MEFLHVGCKFGVGNHVYYAALLHDVMPVGDCRREVEVLLNKNDVETFLLKFPDCPADLLDDNRRQAFRRFVKKKGARAGSQNASNGQHLLLSSGQLGALARAPFPDVWEQLIDTGQLQAAGLHRGRQHEIFFHGKAGKYTAFLGAVANAEPRDGSGGEADSLMAPENDGPAPFAKNADDGTECCCFPSAIAAKKRDDLARTEIEVHAMENVAFSVPRFESADAQNRRGIHGHMRSGRHRGAKHGPPRYMPR